MFCSSPLYLREQLLHNPATNLLLRAWYPFFLQPELHPAFICAGYFLLELCYQNLPHIDQFRVVVLTVLTNHYKTIKELPLSNQIDQRGDDLMIPPLPHNIGTWRGLEGMENKDIQLCEGQQEDRSNSYGFQLKERERRIKEVKEIAQENAAKCQWPSMEGSNSDDDPDLFLALCTTKERSKEKSLKEENYELVLSDYNHVWDVRINPLWLSQCMFKCMFHNWCN